MRDIIVGGLVIGLIVCFSLGVGYILQSGFQKEAMENSCDWILDRGHANNNNAKDVWGNQMKLFYEVKKDYRKATVRSMGRDGVPNTGDDWEFSKYDYNKSYQIGKYAAERAKQLLDGAVEGLQEEDKFKESKDVN